MKNFLTAQEVVILREAHYDSQFRKRADRIKAILFLNQGFSFEQTAKLLMLDETTIRRYTKEFKQGGVDLPNLNIIERLWLFFHQKILYDKYYETFPEFKEAVLNFFQNIDIPVVARFAYILSKNELTVGLSRSKFICKWYIYKKELKSRLTDSFQVIPA